MSSINGSTCMRPADQCHDRRARRSQRSEHEGGAQHGATE